ncbi:MAG: pilus assembly protein PilM [Anaerolineales bacterium]|nr:pilus assembly protein PilM [Anaerolineales bacterium]
MFKRKTTTINFEGNEIRFLVVKGDNVRSWHTGKIPPEYMHQGQILKPEEIGNFISTTIKELKGSRRNVITSVTGQRSIHRIMRIPTIQDKLLEETIRRKTKQEFAIPLDENDIHWRILSRLDSQMILYVLAVPKIVIDSQVAALKEAKIKPRIVDIKPLALQRMVNQSTSIIVNLESFSLDVIVIVNHIPILVRSVPLETGNLTEEAKLDLLGQELARTVKYYNESNKTNRLPDDTGVYLTGELFDNSQVSNRLDENSDLGERLKTRTSFSVQYPKEPYPVPKNLSITKYAVNLGLSLKSR